MRAMPCDDFGMGVRKVDNKRTETILLPTDDGLSFAYVNDIVHCTADGSYTRVCMNDKSEILISKTMDDVE